MGRSAAEWGDGCKDVQQSESTNSPTDSLHKVIEKLLVPQLFKKFPSFYCRVHHSSLLGPHFLTSLVLFPATCTCGTSHSAAAARAVLAGTVAADGHCWGQGAAVTQWQPAASSNESKSARYTAGGTTAS